MASFLSTFLNIGNYIAYNKILALIIGATETIILGFLVQRQDYWEERGEMYIHTDGNPYFFCTHQDIKDALAISKDAQIRAIANLIRYGIIEKIKVGLPAKNYYRVNLEQVASLVASTSSRKNRQLEVAKTDNKKTQNATSSCIIETSDIEISHNDILPPLSPKKTKFGDYVYLTSEEYDKLVAEFGESAAKEMISILDDYKGASGKKYKSDYRAIRVWVIKKWQQEHAHKGYNYGKKSMSDQLQELESYMKGESSNGGASLNSLPF